MRIRVLGTRGEIRSSTPCHSKHSGVLVDNQIMLDLGEEEFLAYSTKAIFITHLHPDHAFFATTRKLSTDVPIFAPERSTVSDKVMPITGPMKMGNYLITPIRTHHSKRVKSVAYLVATKDQKLLYTGDLISINDNYRRLLTDLKIVITDASFLRKGGMIKKDRETGQLYGHAGIPDIVCLFRPFTRQILLVHFGGWFYRNLTIASSKLDDISRREGTRLTIAYDGMELDLDTM